MNLTCWLPGYNLWVEKSSLLTARGHGQACSWKASCRHQRRTPGPRQRETGLALACKHLSTPPTRLRRHAHWRAELLPLVVIPAVSGAHEAGNIKGSEHTDHCSPKLADNPHQEVCQGQGTPCWEICRGQGETQPLPASQSCLYSFHCLFPPLRGNQSKANLD